MPLLIVDEHSTDGTRALALARGARVIERDWTGFVAARRFALTQVRTPWMFALDADEALDERLRDAIAGAPENVDGYALCRDTYFCGKRMRIWRGERLLRLLRVDGARVEAHPAAGGTAELHERYECAGKVGRLPGRLLHFSYPDPGSYRAKYEAYTEIEAGGLQRARIRGPLGPLLRFVYLLFVRGALWDGWRGWYVAWHSANYTRAVERKVAQRS